MLFRLTARSGILLSLLVHLLVLRALVDDSVSIEPPVKVSRELPLLVDLVEKEDGFIELAGMEILADNDVSTEQAAEVEAVVAVGSDDAPSLDEPSRDDRRAAQDPSRARKTFVDSKTNAALAADYSLALKNSLRGAASGFEPAVGIFEPDAERFRLSDRRWEGEVRIGIYIDPEGLPGRVWVIESSGLPSADLDALDYFRQSRWRPATVNGEPVGWVLERTVAYRQPRSFW